MADIRSTAAEIRRGKKRRRKKKKERNYRMKILWSALLHRETIKSKMLVFCMVLIFTFIFMTFGRHLLDR